MPHAAAQICADASFPQHSAVGLPRVSRRPFSRGPPLHSAASLQWEARHSPRGQRTCAQASKLSATQEQDIEGLDKSYCESFHHSPTCASTDSASDRRCPPAEDSARVTAPASSAQATTSCAPPALRWSRLCGL